MESNNNDFMENGTKDNIGLSSKREEQRDASRLKGGVGSYILQEKRGTIVLVAVILALFSTFYFVNNIFVPNKLFVAGNQLFDQQKYDKAIEKFKEIEDRYPNFYKISQVKSQKNMAEEFKNLEELYNDFKSTSNELTMTELAKMLNKIHKYPDYPEYKRFESELEKELSAKQEEFEKLIVNGDNKAREGLYAEASEYYEQALTSKFDSVKNTVLAKNKAYKIKSVMGDQSYKEGNYEEALTLYTNALAYIVDEESNKNIASLKQKILKTEEAKKAARLKAVKDNPLILVREKYSSIEVLYERSFNEEGKGIYFYVFKDLEEEYNSVATVTVDQDEAYLDVIDEILGIDYPSSFEVNDFNNDGKTEVAIYGSSGAHYSNLNIYEVSSLGAKNIFDGGGDVGVEMYFDEGLNEHVIKTIGRTHEKFGENEVTFFSWNAASEKYEEDSSFIDRSNVEYTYLTLPELDKALVRYVNTEVEVSGYIAYIKEDYTSTNALLILDGAITHVKFGESIPLNKGDFIRVKGTVIGETGDYNWNGVQIFIPSISADSYQY